MQLQGSPTKSIPKYALRDSIPGIYAGKDIFGLDIIYPVYGQADIYSSMVTSDGRAGGLPLPSTPLPPLRSSLPLLLYRNFGPGEKKV